jgi:type I site-specific restriction endonuclease
MFQLNIPFTPIKTKTVEKKVQIWDILRRKYVSCTPEEWVRQQFVHFLVNNKNYLPALMANEVQIALGTTRKRCDTVVYDREMQPLAIIEYKAPDVPVSQKTTDQIVRYNFSLKVPYLLISNGMEHYCLRINYRQMNYRYLEEIPDFSELVIN